MLNPQEEFARVRLNNAVCQGNESEVNRIILRLGERAADVVNNHEIDAAILIEASFRNCINIVRFLLTVPGIDVNAYDRFGYTALMYAAEFGYIDIVRALLAFPGINLEAVNNGDETAATIAQRHGYQQIHDMITSAIHARRASRAAAVAQVTSAMLTLHEQHAHECLDNAACTNNVSTITSIISQLGERATVVVNAPNRSGNTALICAAVFGHVSAVRALLVVHGINVNAANQYGDTALICAATKGDLAVVQILLSFPGIFLEAENNDHMTAAAIAEQYGYQEIHNLITSAIHARRASEAAAAAPAAVAVADAQPVFRADSMAVVRADEMLTSQEEGVRARLIKAVRAGDSSEVDNIISQLGECAAVVVNSSDEEGEIVLFVAIKCGHVAVVRVLLTVNGIDVNAVNRQGAVALIYAFNLNFDALIGAFDFNFIDIFQALLNAPGIDVNAADSSGTTVLMCAVYDSNVEAVRALLAFPGINLEAEDNDHMTAAAIAEQRGAWEIYDLITSAPHTKRAPRVVAPVVAAPSFADRLANIPDFNEETIPKSFIDPISREIMTDPIVCKSGQTYERSSLVSYFKSNGDPVKIDCPVTRINIDIEELENNTCVIIRNLIEEFVFQQEAQYKQRQEQEKKLAAAAAAAASNVNVIDENKPSNEAIPDTEKLHTTRFKMFGNTLSASHSASSLAAQPVEQNNEVEMNCHR